MLSTDWAGCVWEAAEKKKNKTSSCASLHLYSLLSCSNASIKAKYSYSHLQVAVHFLWITSEWYKTIVREEFGEKLNV